MTFSIKNKFKKYYPKTILLRFILIITIPLVLSQLIYVYVFFERYFDKNNYRASELLVQEICIINNEFDREYFLNADEKYIIDNLQNLSTSKVSFINSNNLNLDENLIKKSDEKFFKFNSKNYLVKLLSELKNNDIYLIEGNKGNYEVFIRKYNGFLNIKLDKNRIVPVSPKLLLFLTIFSSTTLIIISCMFMKNQIKSIKNLTKTMTDFSLLDKDNEYFIPKGASEIREMGQAFLKMQKEIKKYVNSRTIMLAEISHDLRTPLTRMNLETEFIEDCEIKKDLKEDIDEMQKMINEYLMFAKDENGDVFEETNIVNFFNSIIKDYKRSGYTNITLETDITVQKIKIKKDLFKRALNNIINNSLKYAKKIFISVTSNNNGLFISLEDNGSGVSEEMYNKITKPFFRLNKESKENNVGLGLAITKNIVYKHKGKISFGKSKRLGGFMVEINIPNPNS